ncbi:MAG: hypothetical protein SFU85_02160 [Candidatus Methylacidiphilales bacterium]|nr:hypothetical protein [Candidatus Methylacidiphilales bacterium]
MKQSLRSLLAVGFMVLVGACAHQQIPPTEGQAGSTQNGTSDTQAAPPLSTAAPLPSAPTVADPSGKPALLLQLSAPESAERGSDIPLTLTATNPGGVALNHVRIEAGKGNDAVLPGNGKGEPLHVGPLAPGETRVISCTIRSAKLGPLALAVRALSNECRSEDVRTQIRVVGPALKARITAPASTTRGGPLSYEITVTNEGEGKAVGVVLTSPLTSGCTFVSASHGGKLVKNLITWPAVDMGPNTTTSVRVEVRPANTRTVRTEASVRDAASVTASASAQTAVTGLSALLLEVTDAPDPIEVGGTTAYTIRATNQGSAPDQNITLVCTLEDNEMFVSAGGATTATSNGGVITFSPLPTLEAGATAIWKVTVKGAKASDSRFKVSLTSTALVRPVEETESTKIY